MDVPYVVSVGDWLLQVEGLNPIHSIVKENERKKIVQYYMKIVDYIHSFQRRKVLHEWKNATLFPHVGLECTLLFHIFIPSAYYAKGVFSSPCLSVIYPLSVDTITF